MILILARAGNFGGKEEKGFRERRQKHFLWLGEDKGD